MPASVETIAIVILAYLLGSIPFGLVLTKMAGLGDVRDIGSGNIGATNVLRTGRKDLALATLLLDAGKGAIAVLVCTNFASMELAPLAGSAAFIGHCFPIYLKFKGGKGVATFFGTLLAINPIVAVLSMLSWLLSALLFRISSLSALIASIAAPVFAYVLIPNITWLYTVFMTAVIFIRHKDNIGRIMGGTEPKIGKKSSADDENTANTDSSE
ncbi:glycerol-3-phosphate 1-O-acyltransferase PlsY [Kordiimonas sp. SCSIO 12610]|uniref:glycerol-3-phosphate 1-O-acyltransferase PlsY n=1 Tax=Kordiimonas sp. SCSIO 12610 TaxID=2829597 RepID=UPI00210BA0B3|nr:glycerol-3-phosphate 1-O-acyltransferase PlsY [Kordiimonas sp. SCSIO 12610]UTW54254.1 glycerol-3-phosphate 1-O-acyltransferase PlsY [Kordiimonas sp. SCSIO 12610]